MSRFVIDASIVLNWCFPDEDNALTQHVADKFKAGDTALAPSFWPHEVLNALLAGEKRKRISSGLIQNFLQDLQMLPVELDYSHSRNVFENIEPLAHRHELTAYDAAYLELALRNNLPLASLDEDLVRACKKSGAVLVKL